MLYNYEAKVVKVIDGDTIDFDVSLGFDVTRRIRTRLKGINAPEVSTAEGREARDWLRKNLPVGQPVLITTSKYPGDKYGRWLATVQCEVFGNVAERMLAEGHAVIFMP